MIDLDDEDTVLNLIGVAMAVLLIALIGSIILWTSAAQTGSSIPDTSWNLTRVNESHAKITHVGGESVQTERLSVMVNQTARPTNWSAPVISNGEYGVVRVEEDTTLRILWRPDGSEPTVLYRWDNTSGTT